MPRKSFKDEDNLARILSVRISNRMWFGLHLVSRFRREPLSVITQRLVKGVLEGKASAIADFHVEDLDDLFHELPWERLQRLHDRRPELLTHPERQALKFVQSSTDAMDAQQWSEVQREFGLNLDCWR